MATRVEPSRHRCMGQLLVDGGFIDQTQLDNALTARKQGSRRLGEVLEDGRAITSTDTRAVLQLQKQLDQCDIELADDGSLPEALQLTLGQLLINNGVITSVQLERALIAHRREHSRLGETLVSQQSISKEKLGVWLGLQRKLIAAASAAVLMAGLAGQVLDNGNDAEQAGTVNIEVLSDNAGASVQPEPQDPFIDIGALPESLGLSEFQKTQVERFTPSTLESAERFEVSAELVMAMIHTESSFNDQAQSRRAAIGLMQVIPEYGGVEATRHAKGPAETPCRDTLLDPETNIEVGTAYLAMLNTHYLGFIDDPELRTLASVAAYNWGPTSLRRMFQRHGEPATVVDFKAMIAKHAPTETRNYIERVEKRMPLYAAYLAPSVQYADAGEFVDEPGTA